MKQEAAELWSFAALHFWDQFSRSRGMRIFFAIASKGEHPSRSPF
jgi:hypothetical protein